MCHFLDHPVNCSEMTLNDRQRLCRKPYQMVIYNVFYSSEFCWHAAPCNATWTVYADSNIFGGSRVSSANDVTTCLQVCNANLRCRAVDYNAANPVGLRCFLQLSASAHINVGMFASISHYSISRVCPGELLTLPSGWRPGNYRWLVHIAVQCAAWVSL